MTGKSVAFGGGLGAEIWGKMIALMVDHPVGDVGELEDIGDWVDARQPRHNRGR